MRCMPRKFSSSALPAIELYSLHSMIDRFKVNETLASCILPEDKKAYSPISTTNTGNLAIPSS